MTDFSLTMLPASEGDCLILSWGREDERRHALIDLGRTADYKTNRAALAAIGRFELFVVTHIDADHIEEYVPLDKGGPPDQTNSENLARLCRFHHRVKTHTRWRYRRQPDGTYQWTSPHGHIFTVDEHGTIPRSCAVAVVRAD